jgi:hypothetical protein
MKRPICRLTAAERARHDGLRLVPLSLAQRCRLGDNRVEDGAKALVHASAARKGRRRFDLAHES